MITNPYAGYGSPVVGEEFVGRSAQISAIRSRTFTSLETAPVSIVGPPRVGKSSLARHVLDQYAVGLSARGLRFIPVWITVSGFDSEQSLFRELVNQVQTRLEDDGGDAVGRLRPLHAALESTETWDAMRMRLRTYLRQLRHLGHQVVAVLDEFDAARNIFKRSAPFELLRAIAYETDVRVALITTSRRDLSEIVVRSTPELSTFPQIFGLPFTLGCFTERELGTLLDRSPHIDGGFREELLPWLARDTGGQPYLASARLAVLHDRWAMEGLPTRTRMREQLADTVSACRELTVRHHEQMLELLRDEGRLKTLLEILFGPQIDAQPLDAERLEREGVIRSTDTGWEGFSESFHQYLGLLERTFDDWPLWQQTETRLRSALTDALETAYGDLWPVKLDESQKRLVAQLSDRQDRARRGFGELAPDDNLLEYGYPHELLAIIMIHWDRLGTSLGRTKEEWRQRLELISQVRTPMAHNRRAGTSPLLMERFRECCQEVLEWLPAAAPRPAP